MTSAMRNVVINITVMQARPERKINWLERTEQRILKLKMKKKLINSNTNQTDNSETKNEKKA